MKKLHFLLSTFLVFIFTSCGEDELKGVVLSEDPGYVKEPLVSHTGRRWHRELDKWSY